MPAHCRSTDEGQRIAYLTRPGTRWLLGACVDWQERYLRIRDPLAAELLRGRPRNEEVPVVREIVPAAKAAAGQEAYQLADESQAPAENHHQAGGGAPRGGARGGRARTAARGSASRGSGSPASRARGRGARTHPLPRGNVATGCLHPTIRCSLTQAEVAEREAPEAAAGEADSTTAPRCSGRAGKKPARAVEGPKQVRKKARLVELGCLFAAIEGVVFGHLAAIYPPPRYPNFEVQLQNSELRQQRGVHCAIELD
jgi:hypothetical protein